MISAIPYSLISPLLPTLGQANNLSDTILGWIISLYPLSMSIFSPIIPILGKKFSRIKLLSFATFLISIITAFYGFLLLISNRTLLLIIIFTMRFFMEFVLLL